jgi:hypothetical protein
MVQEISAGLDRHPRDDVGSVGEGERKSMRGSGMGMKEVGVAKLHGKFILLASEGDLGSYIGELRRITITGGLLGVAALMALGVVWGFRGYEERLEAEREVLRHEIVVLSVARERQAVVVYSAEERARNARALLEQVRTLEQEKRVKEADELLVRERAEWEAIHDQEIRDYEKLRGRGSLLGSGR